MKNILNKSFFLLALGILGIQPKLSAQGGGGGGNGSPNSGGYCVGSYATGQCNQGGPSNNPGNFINDFINTFITSGGNPNINNSNSGCNGNPNNYAFYCSQYIAVQPGAVITATLQSGITFGQGFAIYVDWNQNSVFDMPVEVVAATAGVPAAGTFTTLTFTIPPNQPAGTYRLRVRCSFATPGTMIDPCANLTFGETEDYLLYVAGPNGVNPPGIVTGTATNNGPLCQNQNLFLNIATSSTVPLTYTWTGPGGYTTTTGSPTIAAVQPTNAGIYTVNVGSACPFSATTQVVVVPLPIYAVTPMNLTICQAQSFLASVIIANPQNYSYQWATNSPILNLVAPNAAGMQVTTNPISTLTATAIYSVTVTPTVLNCPVTTTMQLTVNNPPTPILLAPAPLCNTLAISSMTAIPAGGTWYGNPIVGPTGIITPNAATQFGIFPVNYSIAIGICTATNQVNLSINQYRSAQLTGGIPNQCTLNNPFNLMSIVQNTTGGWAGTGVNDPGQAYFNPANLLTGTYLLSYFTTSTPNPQVCPAQSTATVQVFNPATPTINPILPQCTNSPTVQLTATPGGGTWTGNAGVNVQGGYNPANATNNTGVNNVIYTAGQGTCVASSSATFHVTRFNTAALTSTNLALCGNSPTVNLMSLAQSTTGGVWSGINVNMTNSSFSPLGLATGTYQLTYNTNSTPAWNPAAIPAMKQCTMSSQMKVSVLNPVLSTIVQIPPICTADAPVQLTVTAPTGAFIPTQYLTAGGIFTPSLAIPGNNQVQYMVGTSTCNVVDSKTISVEAFVPATITGIVPDQCNTGQVVSLLPLGLYPGSWSGPGVLGSSFNPGMSGTGNITITHMTSSSPGGLCPDQKSISVAVYSLAAPAITPEGPYCSSHAPITIKATPIGGRFESSSSYAVSPEGVFNPGFAAIGQNVINYSVTAGPCIAYISSIIQIEEFVSADFSNYVIPQCKSNPPIDLNSYVQRPGGTWSGPGMLGSVFTPSNANIGMNNIVIYRTHSPTEFLCPDSSAMRITVNDVPELTINSDVKQGCAPVEANFNIPNTNTGRGTWVFGDGIEVQGLTATHVYAVPGTYSVVFNYWTANTDCPAQVILKEPLTVFEVPQPLFNYGPYEEVTISDPEVQFVNSTAKLGSNTYQWQIANMYTLTELNPKVRFPKTGEYRISLTAVNTHGCKSEFSELLVVHPDFHVFIPNSFSPNFDGINDEFFPVFSPFGLDPKTYEMEIFDRWGKSLFQTKDINKGWNGLNKGGEAVKEDSYVYRIRYKDLEGRVYSKVGNVTLVN